MARKSPASGRPKRACLPHSGPAITTLVADVSRMACQLMASAFGQSAYAIEVAALAVDSLEVQGAVNEFQPDVAVISAGLKDGPKMGLKAARELWVSGSKTKAIILIDANMSGGVTEVLRAGAHGIIGRDEPFETLCKCIYVVHQGQVWISSSQLLGLIDYLVKTAPPSMVAVDGSTLLTKREEGVVGLVAEGLTNRAISHQLNLSEHTVRNYLFRIFNKLGTSNRLELALYVNNQKELRRISEGRGKNLGSHNLSPESQGTL
jgi:DNA-binding NarL/FixJ family response regulator